MAKTKAGFSNDHAGSTTRGSEEQVGQVIDIIRMMGETGLAELDLETSDLKVSLRRHSPQVVPPPNAVMNPVPVPVLPVASGPSVPPMPASGAVVAPKAAPPAPAPAPEAAFHKILSPMAGTFYRAPSPTSPPYVNEGEAVVAGKPVCIVEAMKLMNEIKADRAGKVVKVLIENAQPVDKGTPLFLIDPGI